MSCKAPVPCHTFLFTLQEIAPDHFLSDFYELSEAEYLVLTTRTRQARKEITGWPSSLEMGTGGTFARSILCTVTPAGRSRSRVVSASGLLVKIPARWDRVIRYSSLFCRESWNKRAFDYTMPSCLQ